MNADEAQRTLAEAECLYTDTQVQHALDTMARAISAKLANSDPLILCVMTGGVIPAGHLLTRLNFPLQIDYIHATRYRGDTQGGRLHWIVRPQHPLKGRTVLIIDDILDEGVTLNAIIEHCWSEGAHEVYTAVLINKKHTRKEPVTVNFVGLETADRYLFGYGMDYKGYLRNAPGIYAVKGL
ncbi:MAG: hypoxanthine-guanine phosphoribosyltransferase [Gammaproteobacteria bacterium]|nr:hypoxanthine-guanine phosphoribosyltransferase [Gammaproteobacteria bacterium]